MTMTVKRCMIGAVVAAAVAWCSCARAADAAAGTATTNAVDKAVLHQRMLERTGGIITVPGKGKIVVMNGQRRIAETTVRLFADNLASIFRARVDVEPIDGFTVVGADEQRRGRQANVAFYLVEDSSLPISLVSMEGRWAAINVSKVADRDVSAETLKKRTMRELQRVMKALMTSVVVNGDTAQIVIKGDDLDEVAGGVITPAVMVEMLTGLPAWGITPERTSTYKRACRQGWAPAPTNEFQKAIYEQVKADKERGPTNPITIQPPKKK